MRLTLVLTMVFCAAAYADVITLKNGRVVNGTYLGGDARTVKVAEGDQVETFQVSDVARIDFGTGDAMPAPPSDRPVLKRSGSSASASSPDSDSGRPTLRRADSYPTSSSSSSSGSYDDSRPTLRRADSADSDTGSSQGQGSRPPAPIMRPDAEPSVSSPPQPAPAPAPIQLAAGTNLVIRMIDAVDSENNSVGQTFRASLDAPVTVNGQTVIPRGADAVVKLVDSKDSGKLTGRAELALALMSVNVNGRMVDINTQTVSRESDSRGKKTAEKAVVGGVLGTIIGAAAGGGKGAAVGAGAGAAAGTGVEAVSKGEKVKVPSEARLTFVLDTAVNI
jgi:hypothetical protein